MTKAVPEGLRLSTRSGLPDALHVLLTAYPRDVWEDHPNFGGVVRFWLERHLMFRDLTARLRTEADAFLDRRDDFDAYVPKLSRVGEFFLNQLHGHRQVEDLHYFPRLVELDPRIAAGFDMLEMDHQDIDERLQLFAQSANAALRGQPAASHAAAGEFHTSPVQFGSLLERHLADEEDLIVPVILKSGFEG